LFLCLGHVVICYSKKIEIWKIINYYKLIKLNEILLYY
jgi:hypothetical protein